MAEVKQLKDALIDQVREGTLAPEKAVESFNKLSRGEIRSGRVYTPKSSAERYKSYLESRAVRDAVQRNKIPFMSPNFFPGFYLCQGLVLIGAKSGRGKSTIAGNVEAGILANCPDSRVMHITNEENEDAVYERIAAIILQIPFYKVHHKQLGRHEEEKVRRFIAENVAPRVEVVSEGDFDTSNEEDVISIMEAAAREGFTATILDYHQNITSSRSNPQKETFKVSKDMGLYYKEYGKRTAMPVIAFAQLSAKADQSEFKDRVENDKTLFNHAFIAIEAIPDFEAMATTFKMHKDRFCETTGKEVVLQFKGGRFVFPGDESL